MWCSIGWLASPVKPQYVASYLSRKERSFDVLISNTFPQSSSSFLGGHVNTDSRTRNFHFDTGSDGRLGFLPLPQSSCFSHRLASGLSMFYVHSFIVLRASSSNISLHRIRLNMLTSDCSACNAQYSRLWTRQIGLRIHHQNVATSESSRISLAAPCQWQCICTVRNCGLGTQPSKYVP